MRGGAEGEGGRGDKTCHLFPRYTRQKKKRTTTIFSLSSPFNMKMLIAMKYSFLIKSY